MRSLPVVLLGVGMTRTTQTVLALAWRPSSEIIHTHVHMPRLLAAATIRGQQLFEGSVYSKKYGMKHSLYDTEPMHETARQRKKAAWVPILRSIEAYANLLMALYNRLLNNYIQPTQRAAMLQICLNYTQPCQCPTLELTRTCM